MVSEVRELGGFWGAVEKIRRVGGVVKRCTFVNLYTGEDLMRLGLSCVRQAQGQPLHRALIRLGFVICLARSFMSRRPFRMSVDLKSSISFGAGGLPSAPTLVVDVVWGERVAWDTPLPPAGRGESEKKA